MALRSCSFHAELFEPATLQWAGWHYAQRIYRHLINAEALTYNAWNIFADAYPNEVDRQQEFHIFQSEQWSYEPTQLLSIIGRLGKLDSSFITLLCVRDFHLTFEHLTALIGIPTLAALVLEQARPSGEVGISARDFLNFGRAVRERKAFLQLRLIVLCDFGIGRKAVLDGVSGFPSLQLVGLQNSKIGVSAGMTQDIVEGWRFMTDSELEQRGLSPSAFDPQSIWTKSYTTRTRKIQQLYDLTKVLQRTSGESAEEYRSLSLTYGGWANRSIYEATAWFIRDFLQEVSECSKAEKTVANAPKRDGNVAKKRKIRTTKQMDVGSFLGAFG
ncbi:hypothetical protein IQ06DRAFT_232421 [Phaeosphaeriaceae sp. SRC1lsM3a]|nr:hypothetical protein IQ06DRAFT_232421 [Stagonospora sp. SRC1lsM3a]